MDCWVVYLPYILPHPNRRVPAVPTATRAEHPVTTVAGRAVATPDRPATPTSGGAMQGSRATADTRMSGLGRATLIFRQSRSR